MGCGATEARKSGHLSVDTKKRPACGIILAMRKPVIDWAWVRDELFRKERIDKVRDAGQKRIISACADECIEIAKRLANPALCAAKKPLSCLGVPRLASRHLKGALHVELFAVTIGPRLERESRARMAGGDSLRGYLLDRIGSMAAESAAEWAETALREKYARAGMSVSARYSPGYCDFPIEKQRALSRLAGFSRAGIRLSKSCMMVPVKSVSAVVGIGPSGLFRKAKTQCVRCGKKDCSYRRNSKS